MVSLGQDLKMAVWDIRAFREVNNYFLHQPGSSVSISDRNLTAVSWGTQTSIWKGLFDKSLVDQEKIQSPYMGWGGKPNALSASSGVHLKTCLASLTTKAFQVSLSRAPGNRISTL